MGAAHMARATTPGIDHNAPRTPSGSLGVSSQVLTPEQRAAAQQDRATAAQQDRLLDDAMTLSQADAQRAVPRPRTDNLNEKLARRIPPDNAVRTRASSRLKKRLSVQKNTWVKSLPNTRRNAIRDIASQEGVKRLELLNRSLASKHGNANQLPPNTHEAIRRIDSAISDYERNNVAVATVYTPAQPPPGMSNDDFADHLQGVSDNGGRVAFDRYVMADHSIHQAAAAQAPASATGGAPLVWEYETARGAYLGDSDSTTNGLHILARGNQAEVVGVKTVTVQNPDGTTFSQRVIQIRDYIDPSTRTSAKN